LNAKTVNIGPIDAATFRVPDRTFSDQISAARDAYRFQE